MCCGRIESLIGTVSTVTAQPLMSVKVYSLYPFYVSDDIPSPWSHHPAGCCPDRVNDLSSGSVSLFLCSVGFWSEAKHIMSFLCISSSFYLRTSLASFCLFLYVQRRVFLEMIVCLG